MSAESFACNGVHSRCRDSITRADHPTCNAQGKLIVLTSKNDRGAVYRVERYRNTKQLHSQILTGKIGRKFFLKWCPPPVVETQFFRARGRRPKTKTFRGTRTTLLRERFSRLLFGCGCGCFPSFLQAEARGYFPSLLGASEICALPRWDVDGLPNLF